MTGADVIRTRPITPTEVLDGLRDLFCRLSGLNWEVAVEEVTFDTPTDTAVFAHVDDLNIIERYFGIDPLPGEWWERVGEYGTVGGLCEALARFVEVPVVEAVTMYGRPCRTTGAFELVGKLLARAGADVSELRPSSPLLPYLWLWPDVFRWDLPRLAPGRVPEPRFKNKRLTRRVLGIVMGLGGLVFALWVSRRQPVVGGVLAGIFLKLFILDIVLSFWAARLRNWSIDFGHLYDFRDLAAAIAGYHEPRAAAA